MGESFLDAISLYFLGDSPLLALKALMKLEVELYPSKSAIELMETFVVYQSLI